MSAAGNGDPVIYVIVAAIGAITTLGGTWIKNRVRKENVISDADMKTVQSALSSSHDALSHARERLGVMEAEVKNLKHRVKRLEDQYDREH